MGLRRGDWYLYELEYVIYSWRPASVQCWKEFKLLVCIVLVSFASIISIIHPPFALDDYCLYYICIPQASSCSTYPHIQLKWQQFSTGNSSKRCIGQRYYSRMVSCKFHVFSFPIPDDDYPNHLGNHLGEKTYGCFLGHWGAPKSSMFFLDFPICKPSSCWGAPLWF